VTTFKTLPRWWKIRICVSYHTRKDLRRQSLCTNRPTCMWVHVECVIQWVATDQVWASPVPLRIWEIFSCPVGVEATDISTVSHYLHFANNNRWYTGSQFTLIIGCRDCECLWPLIWKTWKKLSILIAVREMPESLLNPFLGPFKPLGACIYRRDWQILWHTAGVTARHTVTFPLAQQHCHYPLASTHFPSRTVGGWVGPSGWL